MQTIKIQDWVLQDKSNTQTKQFKHAYLTRQKVAQIERIEKWSGKLYVQCSLFESKTQHKTTNSTSPCPRRYYWFGKMFDLNRNGSEAIYRAVVQTVPFKFRRNLSTNGRPALLLVVVGWLLNVPATCECISGTDLLRQFYVLPH